MFLTGNRDYFSFLLSNIQSKGELLVGKILLAYSKIDGQSTRCGATSNIEGECLSIAGLTSGNTANINCFFAGIDNAMLVKINGEPSRYRHQDHLYF